jgi:hypothetical protein
MITKLTTKADIEKYFMEAIDEKIEEIIRKFQYVGETCIEEARKSGEWQDQTGNLRSSIGYIILVDGKIEDEKIFKSEKGTDRETGVQTGEAFMNELTGQYPSGIVLIVVAGMKYAAAVAAKGYNVMDSAEVLAQDLIPKLLKELK